MSCLEFIYLFNVCFMMMLNNLDHATLRGRVVIGENELASIQYDVVLMLLKYSMSPTFACRD